MASNWPAAIDHFTNPSPSTPMNQAGDPHSKMHGDAFDAITAIETSVGAAGGIAALDSGGKIAVAAVPDLSNSYVSAAAGSGPLATPFVTQGLYARAVPAPSGEASIQAVCTDPNNTGYLWAVGATSGEIGYTSDNGTTFHPVIAVPTSQAIVQALITPNFMWLLTTAGTSKSGQCWQSPAPNATGSNLAFTKIFDLTGLVNGPGGATGNGPSNSAFRVACLAVQPDESAAYLLTYGGGNDSINLGSASGGIMAAGSDILAVPAGTGLFTGIAAGAQITVAGAGASGGTLTSTVADVFSNKKVRLVDCAQTSVSSATVTLPAQTFGSQNVIGGPFIYVSTNVSGPAASITWTNTKFWGFARHGHSVKIVGGVPWVSLGDFPFPSSPDMPQPPSTHVGVWAATSSAGTTWQQITAANVGAGPYDIINMFPITVAGQAMIVGEADNKFSTGPIFVPTQSNAAQVVPVSPLRTFLPYIQTMRSLCATAEGNLMWYGTGESGSVGPLDGIWISKPPFDRAFLLESLPLGTIANPQEGIAQGGYLWIGNNRITREKFLGQ